MFKNAIVRIPSSRISEGISSANLGKPVYENALKQHSEYVAALSKTGVNVVVLEPQDDYPDSCFVEDVALCTRKCVIITNPGAKSRRGEASLLDIQESLKRFYENIEYIKNPGTLEGGDVMMVGDHFYIGLSERTNQEGASQAIKILEKYNLSGSIVSLSEVLHLKTGLSYIENNNLLVAGEFKTKSEFSKFHRIELPDNESYSANCIWMNGFVIIPKGYSVVKQKVAALGYEILEVDTSEFRKIDGGLSCLSLRF